MFAAMKVFVLLEFVSSCVSVSIPFSDLGGLYLLFLLVSFPSSSPSFPLSISYFVTVPHLSQFGIWPYVLFFSRCHKTLHPSNWPTLSGCSWRHSTMFAQPCMKISPSESSSDIDEGTAVNHGLGLKLSTTRRVPLGLQANEPVQGRRLAEHEETQHPPLWHRAFLPRWVSPALEALPRWTSVFWQEPPTSRPSKVPLAAYHHLSSCLCWPTHSALSCSESSSALP